MKQNDVGAVDETDRSFRDPKGTPPSSRVRRERAVRMARQRKPIRAKEVPVVSTFEPPEQTPEAAFVLTNREREVALLIAQSLTAKGIALKLGISAHTATRHTEAIMRKMKVRSRVAVAAHMLRHSIID